MTWQPGRRLRVLIVEDETELLDAMVTYLNMEGFIADGVASLTAAMQWMRTHAFDVLVLDLGLPDGDGLDWLDAHPQLRDKGVIITTARGNDTHRISGVRAGADVYLVKPVLLEELTLLISNLARRLPPQPVRHWQLSAVNWMMLSPDGERIRLTHSEYVILGELALTPGIPVPRQALVRALGHDPQTYDPRRLEILVRRLRAKALAAVGHPLPLETVHRSGYAFTAPIDRA